ncbi:unnamed protein product, partial [marine sediment metagenome]
MLLPDSEENIELFDRGVSLLIQKGIVAIEYFAPAHHVVEREEILRQKGMQGIYLAAILQKRQNLNLSSLDENERRKAVDETLKCIDASKAAKVATVLVTSGARPENELQKEEGLLAFQDSLEEICTYGGKDITITIEPGDSNVNFFQLIGPTAQAAALMRQMVGRGIGNLALTMDISHLAMLGEEITPSLEEVIPYCSHIHLANCILDKTDPLYGDKHPPFSVKNGCYDPAVAKDVIDWLQNNYPDRDFLVSIEIMSRAEDQW